MTEWWHTHSLLIPSFRRGDHRSPHIAPISRLCRLLPSTGAFFASPEERWHAVMEWWHTHSLLIPSFRRGDHRSPYIAPSVGAIIGRHTQPPLSRLCRQLPSMGAFSLLEEWWQHPKLNLYKINLNLFQKTIDKQKNVCYNELINQ